MITENYARSAFSRRVDATLRNAQTKFADALFPGEAQAFALLDDLKIVSVPTRIIWGRQDAVMPWEHALNAPGHVSLNLFDQTGHLPHIERAAEVAALIDATT